MKTTVSDGTTKDFDETKCTSHHPWCGDDTYALGRGVIKPQAMVGAKAALGHGDTGVPQYLCHKWDFFDLVRFYVGVG